MRDTPLILFACCRASIGSPLRYKAFVHIFYHFFFVDGPKLEDFSEKAGSQDSANVYAISELHFSKIDNIRFLLPYNHLYVSYDTLVCTKSLAGSQ